MVNTSPKQVLLIAGPTASGKSALAMKTARDSNGVIINADSMQVYQDLRIITARPTVEEEAEVAHRLYGHVGGATDYSVAAWLADAKAEIETCWQTGKLPIICGGTGLYFMALEKGLAMLPPIDPSIREKWRSFTGDLYAELLARDHSSALKLNPADHQRLIRALEVIEGTGKPLLQWQKEAEQSAFLKDVSVERHFIDTPREELYLRADQRFDHMIKQGALNEVQTLPKLSADQPLMKAIGVQELRDHLAGKITLTQAMDLAKIATRQYIKRQLTWFRGQMKAWKT
jgi:tRNA dimethylallyltransferase